MLRALRLILRTFSNHGTNLMKNQSVKTFLLATFMLVAVGVANTSDAVDGVFEISQACVGPGCVSGDPPGFPVLITESGSYRLTSNLTTNSSNITLIRVTADNVSIDLNGFSLLGPNAGAGTGDGIDAGGRNHINIRNGSIKGMGGAGVAIGGASYLEDLVVAQNRSGGIDASSSFGSLFYRLVVWGNTGNPGVNMPGFAINYIMDSTVTSNNSGGVVGGFCSNVLMSSNSSNSCTAIAPNRCTTPSQCD
ncbi:MAG: hypothetical protein LC637_11040 [Xanthomonadaceae bacterium]|nr:hypothetical protein [Xanthomonadaceae bacterium]